MKKIIKKTQALAVRAMLALTNKRGEGLLDTGIGLLISIVVGSLLLAGLYKLFGTTLIPTLTTKVTSLFSYSG